MSDQPSGLARLVADGITLIIVGIALGGVAMFIWLVIRGIVRLVLWAG